MSHGSHGAHQLLHHLPVEPIIAVVLSLSGLLTSWATYQAELWDGVQLVRYGRAGAYRVEASRAEISADQTRAVEVGLFQGWAAAKVAGDERLARFYEARFPPDLRAAFPQWLEQGGIQDARAAPSPFAMASYNPRARSEAAALERRSEQTFQAGMEAKHTADAFLRASVVLSTAMFLGGIGQVFRNSRVRAGLTAVSVLTLLVGAVQVLRLPAIALH